VTGTRYARSGALRIAYELRGAMHRRPWLVLIQGMGFDRTGWEPVLRKLGRRFRLVLMDNRGTGCSDRPSGSFTVADMAGDVVTVLDAAGIARAHVLGASLPSAVLGGPGRLRRRGGVISAWLGWRRDRWLGSPGPLAFTPPPGACLRCHMLALLRSGLPRLTEV